MASAALLFSGYFKALAMPNDFMPVVRKPLAERKFNSKAIEDLIIEIRNIIVPELSWLFENCFALATDVCTYYEVIDGQPDTFVKSIENDGMFLNNSTLQVWPYLTLCATDKDLQLMIKGVINRQVKCLLIDPYANAFHQDKNKKNERVKHKPTLAPGIYERQWDITSACLPMKLAYGYWKVTGDTSHMDEQWAEAMQKVVDTLREQQFLPDATPEAGKKKNKKEKKDRPAIPANGMIFSNRTDKEGTLSYYYDIPANFIAYACLGHLKELIIASKQKIDLKPIEDLKEQIHNSLVKNARTNKMIFGGIYAREIGNKGEIILSDSGYLPSLLCLGHLVPDIMNDEYYVNTKKFIHTTSNPFYFKGANGDGTGVHYYNTDYLIPASISLRGLTSTDDNEIRHCVKILLAGHSGIGFMQHGFGVNELNRVFGPTSGVGCALFSELIMKVYFEKKAILNGF